MSAIIALDIDGTVADATHHIPDRVQRYLSKLHHEGHLLIFITGRTFSHGFAALSDLPFSYPFVVFNGAVAYQMPEKRMIRSHFLDEAVIEPLRSICADEGNDPLIHTADRCFYRPKRFDKAMRDYFALREKATGEPWVDGDPGGEICYAKVYGERSQLQRIEKRLEGRALTLICEDPYRPGFQILLVTHPLATKGCALREFRDGRRVIAVGDDVNDITMIEEADVGVAMAHGAQELIRKADLVASDVVAGLQKVL